MTEFSDKETIVPGELRGYREWMVVVTSEVSFRLLKTTRMMTGELAGKWYHDIWDVTTESKCHSSFFSCFPSRHFASCEVCRSRAIVPRTREHSSPEMHCDCGLYAYYNFDAINNVDADTSTISGVIAASGKIILGSMGFRAQRARILAFCLPSFIRYGVSREGSWYSPTTGNLDRILRVPGTFNSVFHDRYPGVAIYREKDEAEMYHDFPPDDVSELLK